MFVYRAPDGDTRSAEALSLLASWNTHEDTAGSAAKNPSQLGTAG